MTLDDKSALPAGESRISGTVPLPGPSKNSGGYSFSDVVDETCEKLKNRQIKHSIRRIREMEETLCFLEKELDDFIMQKDRNSK